MRSLLSVLRQPRVIVVEMVTLGVMAVLGTIFPQTGSASEVDLASLRSHGPLLTSMVNLFALDHIFRSAWFAVATILAAASLLLTVTDQLRRLRTAWCRKLTEEDFRNATFHTEVERAAHTAEARGSAGSRIVNLRTEHRLGLAGPPVLHVGILFIIVAGSLQALFGVRAVVDLIEGETLPPVAEAWSRQWPGVWAQPLRLGSPVKLDRVTSSFYATGDLQDLRVGLSIGDGDKARSKELAVNHDLHLQGGRLYLGSDFGLTPLLEWRSGGHAPIRQAPLLAGKAGLVFEGSAVPAPDLKAYLRVRLPGTGERPDRLEARVMQGGALLFTGTVRVGAAVKVAEDLELRLVGLPFWARLHGGRDPALWLAYLGFAFVVSGATIIFAVIRIDTCVVVRAIGDRERVLVALKAHRFGPLFEERFRKLVREQGGAP